jgi:hypothetical protein
MVLYRNAASFDFELIFWPIGTAAKVDVVFIPNPIPQAILIYSQSRDFW